MEVTLFCYHCGKEMKFQDKVYRQELCNQCGQYVHCCKNCRFYDPYAYQQCREPEAEWVSDKEMGNFCGYFKPGENKGSQEALERQKAAKKKLEELFKKQ